MPTIDTLIQDVEAVLASPENHVSTEVAEKLGHDIARKMVERLSERQTRGRLRMSSLGVRCDRKSWYQVNRPEAAEAISPATRLKFLFGDVIEEVMLFLARVAGHDVTHDQHEVNVGGVKGHLDCKIDGVVVDVKSASTPGMKKFKDHLLETDDPFGYLAQAGAYAHAEGQSGMAFWAVDKQHGSQVLDQYENKIDVESLVEHKKAVVALPEPPDRMFTDQKFGESGNRKLGLTCTYCDFKRECWPGLRAFWFNKDRAYMPVYLTEVVREPAVPEETL